MNLNIDHVPKACIGVNDHLGLYSQRIGADGIVDERAKVVDMYSDPLAGHQIFDYVNQIHLIHYLERSAMFE